MRVLIINEVFGITSTGKICAQIAEDYFNKGNEVKVAFGRMTNVPEYLERYAVRIGNDIDVKMAALETRILDNHGLANKKATKRFLEWASIYNPDLLWMHNLHGYYINYEMLFEWIKLRPNMQIKWTLHDCWAMTGHCTHFSFIKCDKWKKQCYDCPQKKCYPTSLFKDNSYDNYIQKKKAFCGIKQLTIITPSNWLADIVKESFLKEYNIEVQYNPINTDVFKKTNSDFREKYGIQKKIILLGVANVWNERKGLYDFYKLSEMLDDRYKIVLVGLTKKQISRLPSKILGLPKTSNQKELAEIYTAADLLVNPSVEETYGMSPVEAKACGTPSVVYEDTACEEIAKINGNMIVSQNVYALYEAIVEYFNN